MPRTTTIELHMDEMQFSAGHFTIFSPTHRENLHGHNFLVQVALTGEVGAHGMLADYEPYKRAIIAQCRAWNETFLMPGESPYLKIERDERGDYVVRFHDEVLHFLKRDMTVLPMENVSLEELARVFGEGLVGDGAALRTARITHVKVQMASRQGQWCSWEWGSRG